VKTRTAVSVARTKSTRQPSSSKQFSSPPTAFEGGPRLVPARTGDHLAIHRLLLAAFHGPTATEFQAQLDEPLYDPADRLIVRHGESVAAHLRTSRRQIHLGSTAVSAVQLMDLATAPEYRGLGFASSLIAAAQRSARERGAQLGLTRTRAATLFARQGWAVCGRHSYATAGARQILAQLQATSEGVAAPRDDDAAAALLRAPKSPINVRPLRRIELPSVMRLYADSLADRWGSPLRSEAYWEWLVNRAAYDRAYVVAEGPESGDLAQQLAAIRGYAFVQQGRLVELAVASSRRELAEHLIARVCADANEQDQWQIRLDSPPDDPLHQLFHAAGGQFAHAEEIGGEVFMAKVLDPVGLMTALGDVFAARYRAAQLQKPLLLGLEIQCGARAGNKSAAELVRLQLVVSPRGLKVISGPLGRTYLSLRRRDLAPLLLGHWHLPDMIEAGRIEASTKTAGEIGRVLFPKLPWWRPPLDDLLS
jgi:predicted N-acetyltransferase YhbS